MVKEKTKNEIDFWTVEGSIYPALDSMGMKGKTSYKKEFHLGANQKLSISVSSKTDPLPSLHQSFTTKNVDFGMDFRNGNDNWFRVDNQGGHDYLHFHLESGGQLFDDRIPIPESTTISGLIANIFEKAEEIVKWKFPNFVINKGENFVGTA